MSALRVIVSRELRERRMVLFGAAGIGTCMLIMAYLPLWNGSPEEFLTQGMSVILQIIITVAAVGAGMSCIGTDLREGRFSFYLSRPTSIRSIWFGKILAAWIFGIGCGLLATIPVSLTGYGLFWTATEFEGRRDLVVFTLVFVPAGIALAHALGISLRSRSAWLLLDILAFVILAFSAAGAIRPYSVTAAHGLAWSLVLFAAVLILISITTAGFLGSSLGRVDLKATHRIQSLGTSTFLLIASILIISISNHLRSVGPEDLQTTDLIPCQSWRCSPVFTGPVEWRADYSPTFAIGPEGAVLLERTLNSNILDFVDVTAAVTPDGRVILWKRISASLNRSHPEMARIVESVRSDPPTPFPMPIWAPMTITDDGSRFAFADANTIQVVESPEDRVIRTFRTESGSALRFLGTDRIIAIERRRPADAEITHFDIITGDVTTHKISGYPFAYDATRQVLLSRAGSLVHITSVRDWKLRFSTDASDAVSTPRGIAIARPSQSAIELRDADGGLIREIRLEPSSGLVTFGHGAGDLLVASVRAEAAGDRRLLVIDLRSGDVRDLGLDLMPARELVPEIAGPYYIRELDGARSLVRLDGDAVSPVAGPIGVRRSS